MLLFDICIHCEITTIKLIKTFITSYGYLFYFLVKTLKIYSHRFQAYSTVLLTMVIILYIRYSELFHLLLKVYIL